MCYTAQLCLPFHWIRREVALWVIWESLCDDFVLFVFLVMFVLMLKASLMAHHCSFRDNVREKGCPRCRPMGVSHRLGMRTLSADSPCTLVQKQWKATALGFHWTACCQSCPSSLSCFQEFLIGRDVKG